MRITILTLFPSAFAGVLSESILRIAQEKGLVRFELVNIRDFAHDRHRSADDKPYGGGPGMVMMPAPVFESVESVEGATEAKKLLLTPQGRLFDQELARELAREKHLLLVCGRYEGFDERIRVGLGAEEISIGDYVLSGGEIAAMAVIDATVRLLTGVLGNERSAVSESFTSGMLDYPQYTRPPEFRGMKVPEVLLSGDHGKIETWRKAEALEKTKQRRPDLLEGRAQENQK